MKPPKPLDPATVARLRAVPSRNTTAELRVRAVVRSLGIGYRIANKDLPGSPDLANRSCRWAMFVHGCFWHAHESCSRAMVPSNNARYWRAKFASNRRRDRKAISDLKRLGFRTLVVWECELASSERALSTRLSKFFEGRRSDFASNRAGKRGRNGIPDLLK